MSDDAGRVLADLIRTYGVELADDRVRTRGLLRDLVYGDDLRVSLILVAQELGVPRALLSARTSNTATLTADRLRADLASSRGLTDASAAWAVAAWAHALDIPLPHSTVLAPLAQPAAAVERSARSVVPTIPVDER